VGAAQVGVDSIAAGPVAIHDHVRIDFHAPVLNDPFPHEVIQGYAFDGADVGLTFEWHWGNTQLRTQVRATPVARSHFAFDQDTDFEPGTNFTHGNAGTARSRTLQHTHKAVSL
jgi:hypothetical protein